MCRAVRSGPLALIVLAALAPAARASLPTRIAAVAGLPASSVPGEPGASLSVIGASQIDAAGDVVSTCRIAGPGIAYGANDLVLLSADRFGRPRLLARTGITSGDASPDLGTASTAFGSTFFPRLRADGAVAAVCFVSGPGFDTSNNTGYWTGNAADITPALRSGASAVPGVPGAQFYGFISGFPCVTGGAGAGIAFSAQLAVGPGGVSIDSYQGIWGPDPSGQLSLIARTGIAQDSGSPGAPPLASATYAQFNPRSLVIASNGRLAFAATLAGPASAPANATVLIERTPSGQLQVVARESAPVPGLPLLAFASLDTGAYATSGGASINSAGDLAFGDIDPLDPPQRGLSRLWLRRADGSFHLLAARNVPFGDGAPVGIAGVFSLITPPALSSAGTVVFSGTVTGLLGVQISGLWAADPSGGIRLIARSGVADSPLSPPGIPGAMFAAAIPVQGTQRINARGQIVFHWKLEDGVGGVSSASDDGVWAYDPALGLLSVVRTGDVLPAVPSAGPVTAINMFHGPAGDDDGRITDVSSRGEVAVTVQCAGSTGAILVAQLPGVGACCRGGVCAQESSDACAGPNTRFAGIGAACTAPAACCAADFNQSGSLSAQDIFDFLAAWFSGSATADIDGAAGLAASDIFTFLAAWFAGC